MKTIYSPLHLGHSGHMELISGAIVLTLRHRPDVRRQKIADQVSRRREDVIEVRDITTGSGA